MIYNKTEAYIAIKEKPKERQTKVELGNFVSDKNVETQHFNWWWWGHRVWIVDTRQGLAMGQVNLVDRSNEKPVQSNKEKH